MFVEFFDSRMNSRLTDKPGPPHAARYPYLNVTLWSQLPTMPTSRAPIQSIDACALLQSERNGGRGGGYDAIASMHACIACTYLLSSQRVSFACAQAFCSSGGVVFDALTYETKMKKKITRTVSVYLCVCVCMCACFICLAPHVVVALGICKCYGIV